MHCVYRNTQNYPIKCGIVLYFDTLICGILLDFKQKIQKKYAIILFLTTNTSCTEPNDFLALINVVVEYLHKL